MPSIAVLTEDDRKRFGQKFRESFPDADTLFQSWAVAWETIAHFLGRDWASRNLKPGAGDPYFLLAAGEASVEAYLRQHRVIMLGHRLFELQDVRGFDEAVKDLRSRNLDGASAELTVVSRFRRRGHEVSFQQRSGVKGQDFDAIATIAGQRVPVEVKAKQEWPTPPFRQSGILNPLNKARKQVPADGPNLIFLQIPSDWASNRLVRATIDGTVRSWLPTTRRVNAVVLMFDQRVPGERGGMAFLGSHDIIPNQRPKTPIRDILNVLGGQRVQGQIRVAGPPQAAP